MQCQGVNFIEGKDTLVFNIRFNPAPPEKVFYNFESEKWRKNRKYITISYSDCVFNECIKKITFGSCVKRELKSVQD
jgi:hypothetical protein